MKNNAVIKNKKARFNYNVDSTLECGVELVGTEVKSISLGMASIKEAWVAIEHGELILKQAHITAYDKGFQADKINPTRDRRLLAHKSEIRALTTKVCQEGYTLIPLKIYCVDNKKYKVLVGVCKGKKNYDKRETIKNRDIEREFRRAVSDKYRG